MPCIFRFAIAGSRRRRNSKNIRRLVSCFCKKICIKLLIGSASCTIQENGRGVRMFGTVPMARTQIGCDRDECSKHLAAPHLGAVVSGRSRSRARCGAAPDRNGAAVSGALCIMRAASVIPSPGLHRAAHERLSSANPVVMRHGASGCPQQRACKRKYRQYGNKLRGVV